MTADLKALALTNYGHFTSMRVDHGAVRGLRLHMDRLTNDCRTLFGADLDLDHVRELCRQAIGGLDLAVLRVTVFDPELDLGHPAEEAKPQILVTARPAASLPAPPMRVQAVRYSRDASAVKHVGLFGTIYLRRLAQINGYDDVLFLDAESKISEGATWNIGFISGDEVVWPEGKILPGVTLRLLEGICSSREARVALDEIRQFDFAIATNANVGVRVVRSIDRFEFPDSNPVVDRLRDRYNEIPMERL